MEHNDLITYIYFCMFDYNDVSIRSRAILNKPEPITELTSPIRDSVCYRAFFKMNTTHDLTQEEFEYQIKLANHKNFYQKQKDVAIRLEQIILKRYYDTNDTTDFDFIVTQEVKKELANLNESEGMGIPNKPGYYRANND